MIPLTYICISNISQSSIYLFIFLKLSLVRYFSLFVLFYLFIFDEIHFLILEIMNFQKDMANYESLSFFFPLTINITQRDRSK